MFAYPCPSCAQKLLAPVDRAGQRTMCPKCLEPLTVPSPDGFSADPFGPPPTDATPFTPPPAAVVETPTPMNTDLPALGDELELDLFVAVEDAHVTRELEPARLDAVAAQTVAAAVATAPTATLPPPQPLPAPRQAVPDVTPQPKKAPKPVARERDGHVVLVPTGLFAVDVAAELSAAISMRMAPPPEPTDRTAVSAAWLMTTAFGLGVAVLGAFHSPTWFPYLMLIGIGMAASGWLWRAYLSGRRGNLAAAALTLLPPGCLVQLFRPFGQYGLQPLLFVVTGLALCALSVNGLAVHDWVEHQIGVAQAAPSITDTPVGPAAKLRAAANKVAALAELASAEKAWPATADEKAEMAKELRAQANAEPAAVRAAALLALAYWSPGEATPLAAERLAVKSDREGAKKALVVIGPDAEASVLLLLGSSSEATILAAVDVLERIGGESAQTELRKLADATSTRAIRIDALDAADSISKRLMRTK